MTDFDWPAVREAFEKWLYPANFDPNGRQLGPLDMAVAVPTAVADLVECRVNV